MASAKRRRNDGWVEPKSTIEATRQYIIENCLEPEPYYDTWLEWRDSLRGYDDKTKIRPIKLWESWEIPRWNKKNKKLLKRRRAMKNGRSTI